MSLNPRPQAMNWVNIESHIHLTYFQNVFTFSWQSTTLIKK
jgi:hypothetical protein